jgi:hypothetical protein
MLDFKLVYKFNNVRIFIGANYVQKCITEK